MEFAAQSVIMAEPEEVYGYHARPGAFARLTPPWERVRLLRAPRSLANNELAILQIPVGPLSLTWVADHQDVVEGEQFCDVQLAGPFAHWHHRHRMELAGDRQTLLSDIITYQLPLGVMGELGGGWLTRTKLERMFRYRHAVTANDLASFAQSALPPARIVITGVTGTIGRALAAFLSCAGHEVIGLIRPGSTPLSWLPCARWDPDRGLLDPAVLEGADAIIHLAGEPIAVRRWTPAQQKRLMDSRVQSTRLLVAAIEQMTIKPSVWLGASGTGYYGDTGPTEFATEATVAGAGFLARLAQEWESASQPLEALGVRRVALRLGWVLTPAGGVLDQLWWPTMLGGAWSLGNGRQWLSWIALDDVLAAILHCLATPSLSGPVNLVAPEPITNAEFTDGLAQALHRPRLASLPEGLLRTMVGPLADEGLLVNSGVIPEQLQASGFRFHYPGLREALAHQLGIDTLEESLQALVSSGR